MLGTAMKKAAGLALPILLSALPTAAQQGSGREDPAWPEISTVSHVVLPQAAGGSYNLRSDRAPIQVEEVRAKVSILESTARTTLEVQLRNPGRSRAEAVLLLPVPAGAVVSSFLFEGASSEPTARLLPREEARRTYDEIVARVKDPALLEFAGSNLVRSSVFPVEPGGRQRVRLTYEELLEEDGGRIDYVLPRSESLSVRVPWKIDVQIDSPSPISMVYSPSHDLETLLRKTRRVQLRVSAAARLAPGPFRISYLPERDEVTASLLAYPDRKVGGGYFLVMAGLPAVPPENGNRLKREVTLVFDRSGSMAGEKMDQARAAALQIVEGLEDGEAFNIIDYSSRVSKFAASPVIKSRKSVLEARDYLAAMRPTGGTNIHDALLEALRQERRQGFLGLVLFMTDGLPTVGRTTEGEISSMVAAANIHQRRIFTFGVGQDVNVPLLDRLSDRTRATSTFVLPGEDVELKLAKVFRRLYGPVLADLELETVDEQGAVTTRAVREILPARLPDLYEGDQLVLLGQYLADRKPLHFRLKGNYLGKERVFSFRFDVSRASTTNSFVPRLWAARKIAFLIDQIRQAGATLAGGPIAVGTDIFSDPRFREIAEEILRLSTEFGILSEYTSFLATEGTDLGEWERLRLACNDELNRRAVRTRFGEGAVSQGHNFNEKKGQVLLNYDNAYWDENNALVSNYGVQQICDRAFFLQGDQWIDSRIISGGQSLQPEREIEFGSEEHAVMLDVLMAQGRQGLLALPGNTLLQYQGKAVLVRNGAPSGNTRK